MLRGRTVGLRARHDDDIAILDTELYDDVAGHSRSDPRPWLPIAPGSASSHHRVGEPNDNSAPFSVVVSAEDDLLAGAAVLWAIDTHNRSAHLGIALRPSMRGKGLGSDVVQVLCHYGFVVRGLQRLQVETFVDNAAMIRAATRAGFQTEGVRRRAAWAGGAFHDEMLLGLLVTEWTQA